MKGRGFPVSHLPIRQLLLFAVLIPAILAPGLTARAVTANEAFDALNVTIERYSPSGDPRDEWGSSGSGPVQRPGRDRRGDAVHLSPTLPFLIREGWVRGFSAY